MNLEYKPYISERILMPWHQGKARETYQSTELYNLVQVTTDRVSTHNHVHQSPIPFKGEVLTMLTIFELTNILKDLPNGLVAWGRNIYDYLPRGIEGLYPDLHHRTIAVKNLDMVPREFIPRRFLTGSMLKYYLAGKDPYGVNLPSGLVQMSRLSQLVFTGTEKSATDDPLQAEELLSEYPDEVTLACEAFELMEAYLAPLGITLVDGKLEIGSKSLADEPITPDSARFTWTKDIKEGTAPPWLDKQIVRDYVEKVCGIGQETSLVLPPDIISQTSEIYLQLLHIITGMTLQEWRVHLDEI